MNNILDEQLMPNNYSRQVITRTIVLTLTLLILSIVFLYGEAYLPDQLSFADIGFSLPGLLIVACIIGYSILLPNNLNKLIPELPIYKVIGITGILVFPIQLALNTILNLHYFGYINFSIILSTVFSSGKIGIFGLLIANIRIHKLRRKKLLVPIMILILTYIISVTFLAWLEY